MKVTMKGKETLQKWRAVDRSAVNAMLDFAAEPLKGNAVVQLSRAAMRLSLYENSSAEFEFKAEDLEDRRRLQSWLAKIVSWGKLSAREKTGILAEIQPWVEEAQATIVTYIEGDSLVRRMAFRFTTTRALIGEVFLSLFKHGFVQSGSVRRCPICKVFFVKYRSDQRVCSTHCRVRKKRGKEKRAA